jgi:hypothetical protein
VQCSCRLSVEDTHGKLEVEEEEDLACDSKTLYVLYYSEIWSVTLIVHVLKCVARERLVKTL